MQRRFAAVLAALFCACDPTIAIEEPAAVVTARFDPSAAVPVVPTPNDLATDPETGLLAITPPGTATGADLAFYEYLESLDGFPTSSGATATFDGELLGTSVTPLGVRVFEVSDTGAVTPTALTTTLVYTAADEGASKSKINIVPPATGWEPGKRYAVALVGGKDGLKASVTDKQVVGSATWSFLRASKPLVTCTDLTSPDCATATEIIPSSVKDTAANRLADQSSKALLLERLRLKYKPVVEKLISDSVPREEILLVWSFKIADFTQVAFDPARTTPGPLVPLPNDLAIDRTTGLVNAPIDPSYSAAYKEFITDYLNTLDGFPTSAVASVTVNGGDLDPASVTSDSVVVLADGAPVEGTVVSWNATNKTIQVAPPAGNWGKGKQLAVVVFGRLATDIGADSPPAAVEAEGGGAVAASSIWAIVRSPSPLVDCTDLTSPDCKLAITAAPLSTAQAISLEQLRRIYKPVLDAVEASGRARNEVAIAWTFRTVSLPELTFDPSASIVPFPNNVLRTTGVGAHLNLPIPDGGSALQQNLVAGLNTLDGFSLTAPIVSESSDSRGALDIANLDPATLDAGTGFLKLAGIGGAPRVVACIDCASSLLPDGGVPANPQQLQFVPQIPLEEQSTYGAYVTTDVKDQDGRRVIASPSFALTRLLNPICDTATMKSNVPVLSDLQACGAGGAPGLEQLRAGLKPMVDGLVAAGLTRKKLGLAWAFTTESTVSQMATLAGAVSAVGLPTTVTSIAPIPKASLMPAALPSAALGPDIYIGTMMLPNAVANAQGVILPPNTWVQQKAQFMLTVPLAAAPVGGYPVVLFGHGLSGNRTTMLAIANSLATAGFATVSIDVIFHGERNTCTGAGSVLKAALGPNATDDYACASPGANTMPDPVNNMCATTGASAGRCVKRSGTGTACVSDVQCITTNAGYCVAGFCEGADFARNASKSPLINSWNFLNLGNLFAARDNFRHFTLDLSQLIRVVKANGFTGVTLDPTKIAYVGQSLGGFNGTLFSAVNTDVKNVMLNVVGSDQTSVLLTSPAFAPQRNGFLGQIAPLGLTPGTPQFDQLMTLVRTIFDRADPQNFAYTSVNANVPGRKVFVQSIQNDFVVPNSTTDTWLRAGQSGPAQAITERVNPTLVPDPAAGACMPAPGALCASQRHGFLLNFVDPGTTAAAQTKAANFVLTGTP